MSGDRPARRASRWRRPRGSWVRPVWAGISAAATFGTLSVAIARPWSFVPTMAAVIVVTVAVNAAVLLTLDWLDQYRERHKRNELQGMQH